LRKSIGPHWIELRHADPHGFAEAVSGKDGFFGFGEVPRGQCILSMGPPSGMSIDIELVYPKDGENNKVLIDNFADGCISATVLSADGGKIVPRLNSTIHGGK
jgi:hypothetical protein